MLKSSLNFIFFFGLSLSAMAQDAQSYSYGQLRAWFHQNGYSEVENLEARSLTRRLGTHSLQILRNDPEARVGLRGETTYRQAFSLFSRLTTLDNFHRYEPNFAGHFQLILSAMNREPSGEERFRAFTALQLVWAGMASDPQNTAEFQDILSRAELTWGTYRASGQQIMDTMRELGVPLLTEDGNFAPLWRAWSAASHETQQVVGHEIPRPQTYFTDYLFSANSDSKDKIKAGVFERLSGDALFSSLPADLQSVLVDVFVDGRPASSENLHQAIKRRFRSRANELPSSGDFELLYASLSDASLSSLTELASPTLMAAENRSRPSAENEVQAQAPATARSDLLSSADLERLFQEHFGTALSSHDRANYNPARGDLITDPRLELLAYLIHRSKRLHGRGDLEIPKELFYPELDQPQFDMTKIFYEVLLMEMDETEVFQAQLERLMPQMRRRIQDQSHSDATIKRGLAFVLAAWATGAESREDFQEYARQDLLDTSTMQWLNSHSSLIFSGPSLSPDIQNWVYFLPSDNYANFSADPERATEVQWMLAHLTTSLKPGPVPSRVRREPAPSLNDIEKYLMDQIDWSKAPQKLKTNFEAQQALVQALLLERYENQKDFGNRAGNSARLRELDVNLKSSYLKSFYADAIKLLRIRLQTSADDPMGTKNAERLKRELEAYLLRTLGLSNGSSLRPQIIQIASDAVFEGEILFDPDWWTTSDKEVWAAYVLSNSLQLDAASHIRSQHPELVAKAMAEAPQLFETRDGYELVRQGDCVGFSRALHGLLR